MPTVNANTPQVQINLPVPTPVQSKPKPKKAPVAGTQASVKQQVTQPTQLDDATQQFTPPPRMRALIIPWTPTPNKMQRKVLVSQPVKYAAPIRAVSSPETAHRQLDQMLGSRQQVRHGRTARIHRLPNGDIGVTLHNTQIVTAHPNGTVTMNHGGYMTRTTQRFISGYTGLGVSFAGGRFMIHNPHTGESHQYENGTPYPPPPPSTEPNRGRLDQHYVDSLQAAHSKGDRSVAGAVGDHLSDNGYTTAGAMLSRYAEGDLGTHMNEYGPYHASIEEYAQNINDPGEFEYHPPTDKHQLHRLTIRLSNGNTIRVIHSGDPKKSSTPTQMKRKIVVKK